MDRYDSFLDGDVLNSANRVQSVSASATTYRQSSKPTGHVSASAGTSEGRKVTFAPLIRVKEDGLYEFGEIEKVGPLVINSIHWMLGEIESRHRQGKIPAHPTSNFKAAHCAWYWATTAGDKRRWSVDKPGSFACCACFKAKRICLSWQGDMKWILLPLPPQVRDEDLTWQDAGYYIYQGSETESSFPGVWEESRRSKKRRQDGGA